MKVPKVLKDNWILLAGAGAAYAVYRYIAGAGEKLLDDMEAYRIAVTPACEPVRPLITSVAEAEDLLAEWGLQVTAEYSGNMCNFKGAFYNSYTYGILQQIEQANNDIPNSIANPNADPQYAMPFEELGDVFVRSHGVEPPFACNGAVNYPFTNVSNLQAENCLPCSGYDESNAFTGDDVCTGGFEEYEDLCSAFPNLSPEDNEFCQFWGFVDFTDYDHEVCGQFYSGLNCNDYEQLDELSYCNSIGYFYGDSYMENLADTCAPTFEMG